MDADSCATVLVTVESQPWRDAIDDLDAFVERVVRAALERGAAEPWLVRGEVSLLLTDDSDIRSINAAYRDRDRPTNVLSFPSLDLEEGRGAPPLAPGRVLLGDVAVSYQRAAKEASALGKPFADHVAHLLVHGALHLLGYDHLDDRRAAAMEGLEASILDALGFAAPYEADVMSSVC